MALTWLPRLHQYFFDTAGVTGTMESPRNLYRIPPHFP